MNGRAAEAESDHVGPTPCATCTACSFAWHSATMAHGLRIIGSCPRCGGELAFAADAGEPGGPAPAPDPDADLPPHAVLGIPRR